MNDRRDIYPPRDPFDENGETYHESRESEAEPIDNEWSGEADHDRQDDQQYAAPADPNAYYNDGPYYAPPNSTGLIIWSILASIFCCQPLGIVAIVFAAMSKSSFEAGDFEKGYDQQRRAKQFLMWAVISYFAILFISFFFVFLMAFIGALAG